MIEVLAASTVLVVGLLGLMLMVDTANRVTNKTKAREAATSLARQLVEGMRGVPFPRLSSATIAANLQAQPGLEGLPASSIYSIRRRGFTYSIDASVCALDDPRDGIGSHASGGFCTGGATGLGDGTNCAAAAAAGGASGLDANGNKLDASLCSTVDGTLVWSSCALLPTSAGAPSNGSEAAAAASATTCQSGTAAGVDTDPQDYKRVVVNVRWKSSRVQQTAVIINPGSSGGPAVTGLTLTGRSSTVVTDNPSSLSFSVTTSSIPTTVSGNVDGHPAGAASGSGTSWSFVWDIKSAAASDAILDGTYLVGARAFDSYSVAGPGRDVNVTLNRSVPKTPTRVAAGRNGSAVDVEWAPNPEADVIGYRVYRQLSGGPRVLACGLTDRTSCQDASPPAGAHVYYDVVALDRDSAGALREGPASTVRDVTNTNTPPTAPGTLSRSTVNGDTRLAWTASTDPDPGDTIDFYRIYRDGTAYSARYDRTGLGSDLTWTDTQTDGAAHTYYVAAVDQQLGESPLTGPVSP